MAFVRNGTSCVHRTGPTTMSTVYIKDLRKVARLGFDLNRILVVDDKRKKLSRNYGNAIYVAPF